MTDDRMVSNNATHETLEMMLTQLGFEDFLANASQVMEIYEIFDQAVARGVDYGQGYQDGFWAARELDAKYQRAKLESITEMISKL
jgi:hypothetical protein